MKVENLSEISIVTDDITNIVNEQNDIEILKRWLKISMKVDGLKEFTEEIRKI